MINYQNLFNEQYRNLPPSEVGKFYEMAASAKDSIILAVGEPDFKTPWKIRKAAIASLEKGRTWYTPDAGMSDLLSAIKNYQKRRFNLDYNQNEIFVTVGGSEAIDMCFRVLLNEGDEVILPTPSYVSYTPIASLCKAKIVEVETFKENDFKLTAQQVKDAITDKTKILVLPFPGNPTGAVMSLEDFEAIAEVIKDTDIIVMTDEIYAELTFGVKHTSFANVEGMKDRTIVINGFSKAYSMTGWRLGYAMGPKEIINAMKLLHGYAIICAPTTSQYAAIVALNECDEEIDAMREEYDMRRKYLIKELNRIGLSTHNVQGAFYAFCDIKSTGLSSQEFCEKLLLEENVVVIPGTAYGKAGEGFIRISYSYSLDHLTQAIHKIENFLLNLKRNG